MNTVISICSFLLFKAGVGSKRLDFFLPGTVRFDPNPGLQTVSPGGILCGAGCLPYVMLCATISPTLPIPLEITCKTFMLIPYRVERPYNLQAMTDGF